MQMWVYSNCVQQCKARLVQLINSSLTQNHNKDIWSQEQVYYNNFLISLQDNFRVDYSPFLARGSSCSSPVSTLRRSALIKMLCAWNKIIIIAHNYYSQICESRFDQLKERLDMGQFHLVNSNQIYPFQIY